jgi:hypothetical protein
VAHPTTQRQRADSPASGCGGPDPALRRKAACFTVPSLEWDSPRASQHSLEPTKARVAQRGLIGDSELGIADTCRSKASLATRTSRRPSSIAGSTASGEAAPFSTSNDCSRSTASWGASWSTREWRPADGRELHRERARMELTESSIVAPVAQSTSGPQRFRHQQQHSVLPPFPQAYGQPAGTRASVAHRIAKAGKPSPPAIALIGADGSMSRRQRPRRRAFPASPTADRPSRPLITAQYVALSPR